MTWSDVKSPPLMILSFRSTTVMLQILIATFLLISWVNPAAAQERYYKVSKVLSGDTLQLESGSVIKYGSVLAPSLEHKSERIRGYAQESLKFNRALMEGRNIRVEWAAKLRNDDGVYQGFIFLEDGSMANLKALEAGYVKLAIEPPNFEYMEELRRAARVSRREQRGLWEYEDAAKVKIEFIGAKMTNKFHFPDCEELDHVSKAHQRTFTSRVKAKAAKNQFCSICRNKYSEATSLF